MNKTALINQIAASAEISKTAATRSLDAALTAIKAALQKGDVVTLVGFGSFHIVERAPRRGRNPRTGGSITIKPGKAVKFRAGKNLKEAVN